MPIKWHSSCDNGSRTAARHLLWAQACGSARTCGHRSARQVASGRQSVPSQVAICGHERYTAAINQWTRHAFTIAPATRELVCRPFAAAAGTAGECRAPPGSPAIRGEPKSIKSTRGLSGSTRKGLSKGCEARPLRVLRIRHVDPVHRECRRGHIPAALGAVDEVDHLVRERRGALGHAGPSQDHHRTTHVDTTSVTW